MDNSFPLWYGHLFSLLEKVERLRLVRFFVLTCFSLAFICHVLSILNQIFFYTKIDTLKPQNWRICREIEIHCKYAGVLLLLEWFGMKHAQTAPT